MQCNYQTLNCYCVYDHWPNMSFDSSWSCMARQAHLVFFTHNKGRQNTLLTTATFLDFCTCPAIQIPTPIWATSWFHSCNASNVYSKTYSSLQMAILPTLLLPLLKPLLVVVRLKRPFSRARNSMASPSFEEYCSSSSRSALKFCPFQSCLFCLSVGGHERRFNAF